MPEADANISRRQMLRHVKGAAILASAVAVATPVLAAPLEDPVLPIIREWHAARHAGRVMATTDEEIDVAVDRYFGAEDRLRTVRATTPAGAAACLEMIRINLVGYYDGSESMLFDDELVSALLASATGVLART